MADNFPKLIDSLTKRVDSLEHYMKDIIASKKEVDELVKEQRAMEEKLAYLRRNDDEIGKKTAQAEYALKGIEKKIQDAAMGTATVKAFAEKAAAEERALEAKREAREIKQIQEMAKFHGDLANQQAKDGMLENRLKSLEATIHHLEGLVQQALTMASGKR